MASHVHDSSVSTAIVKQHVEKILQSGEFSGSEVLRHLLTFLANHSIEKPGEVVKEYELGVAVLGKTDFDPRLDSAVRVHAARLRSKLAEYYMSDGASDPVQIEVPKGSYQVTWRYRNLPAPAPAVEPEAPPPLPLKASVSPWLWFTGGFAAAALLAGITVGIWSSTHGLKLPPVVQSFWQPFLKSPDAPIIVFSNPRFAGSSLTGLHYFQEGVDSPADSNDTYSGTGTVMAVAALSNLFSSSGISPRLKRAELLTWDELKNANAIFVGAPDSNSRLKELAPLQEFRFKSSREEPRYGVGGIVNLHPAAGEEAFYFGGVKPYTFDYAVLALLPNLHPDRKVVILAGTNTYGCQAAAEFLTRGDQLAEIYGRLGISTRDHLPDLEALLKVSISGGVPLKTEVLLVKRRQSKPAPK